MMDAGVKVVVGDPEHEAAGEDELCIEFAVRVIAVKSLALLLVSVQPAPARWA
jgi:hypothetical protein